MSGAASMQAVRMFSTLSCPYCQHAKSLLRQRGVEAIEDVRVDLDPAQRGVMMQLTGRRTVPQIFIDGRIIGGYDELKALDDAGGLDPLLAGHG